MGSPAARRDVVFTAAPLTFDRDGALAYTGWAPKLFAALEKSKQVTGRPYGRNGAIIYPREQLDAVNARLFGGGPVNDVDDEFAGLGKN